MRYVVVLLLFVGLSACASDTPTENPTPSSSLIVSKEDIVLSAANASDSVTVKLSCGCGFDLVVENYTGDTSAIRYSTRSVADLTAKTMAIVFEPNPEAPAGHHTARLAFLSTGSRGDFRDTLTVMYMK